MLLQCIQALPHTYLKTDIPFSLALTFPAYFSGEIPVCVCPIFYVLAYKVYKVYKVFASVAYRVFGAELSRMGWLSAYNVLSHSQMG